MDKKFISVYMYPDTAKEDLKYFKENYNFKLKNYLISSVLLGLAFFFVIFALSVIYFWLYVGISLVVTGLLCFVMSIIFRKKIESKWMVKSIDEYQKVIVKNCIDKYPGYYSLSALYPLYLFFDNNEKVIKVAYQNKEYLCFEYSDVSNYRIMQDKEVLDGRTRLPENPNKKICSYIIEISFKNKKRAQIGINNTCSRFILGGKYGYQQFANTNTINSIARILDCILKKNDVDPSKIKTDTE